MTEPLIAIRDLHYTYLPGTPLQAVALRGASMEVYAGEIVGLIGPAGAGKSTLLQHCNGLLRPTEPGHVIVDGQDLADPTVDLRRLRQMVGIVFQHPERQLFETLVGDDIAFGPRQLGMSRAEIRRRVEWAMRVVGLDFDTFVDRPTAALSGGERRKVAIAGVLALRPRVLILDEASAGLDPLTREEWQEQVRRLNADEGMTVIVVSSDMEEIAALAGRVYVMAEGRMVDEGTPAEVFAHTDLLNSLGLGQPVTSWVLGELRRRGYDVDLYAIRLEETVEELCRILRS
jgi:energy-coupling factor transport system ATP-binding protein